MRGGTRAARPRPHRGLNPGASGAARQGLRKPPMAALDCPARLVHGANMGGRPRCGLATPINHYGRKAVADATRNKFRVVCRRRRGNKKYNACLGAIECLQYMNKIAKYGQKPLDIIYSIGYY